MNEKLPLDGVRKGAADADGGQQQGQHADAAGHPHRQMIFREIGRDEA